MIQKKAFPTNKTDAEYSKDVNDPLGHRWRLIDLQTNFGWIYLELSFDGLKSVDENFVRRIARWRAFKRATNRYNTEGELIPLQTIILIYNSINKIGQKFWNWRRTNRLSDIGPSMVDKPSLGFCELQSLTVIDHHKLSELLNLQFVNLLNRSWIFFDLAEIWFNLVEWNCGKEANHVFN